MATIANMPAFDDGLAETEIPTGTSVETDVLIVGSGPAGGAAALCLATLHVPNIMITKYRWTANTPRAHITNQRAMEIFRDLGIEDQVKADATPHELVGDTVFCTPSLARRSAGSAPGAPTPPGKPTTSSPALAWSATSRRPTWSRSWSRTPPRAAPRLGSPPSTSATPRTRMASPRRYETGSPARCTTSGPST